MTGKVKHIVFDLGFGFVAADNAHYGEGRCGEGQYASAAEFFFHRSGVVSDTAPTISQAGGTYLINFHVIG